MKPLFFFLAIATFLLQGFALEENQLECFFIPPIDWEMVDPHSLSPHVKVAFLKKEGKKFFPSINLSVEETNVSLGAYLKAVKSIHERDRKNHWRALGKMKTPAGLAQLTEIDSHSDLGAIRILQLILIKDQRAYILTAAALREEFSQYYQTFQAAFRSLTLSQDLLSCIPQAERREALKTAQSSLLSQWTTHITESTPSLPFEEPFNQQNWLPFQTQVVNNFADMGAYWQKLFLEATQKKIQSILPQLEEADGQNSQ